MFQRKYILKSLHLLDSGYSVDLDFTQTRYQMSLKNIFVYRWTKVYKIGTIISTLTNYIKNSLHINA